MKRLRRYVESALKHFKRVPLSVRVAVGVAVVIGVYALVFVLPTTVQLNYAQVSTCVSQFTLAPDLQKQRAGTRVFNVTTQDATKVLGVSLFSNKVCMTPTSTPNEGDVKASVAPWGMPVFSKTYKIVTPKAPVADVSSMKNAEISAVKQLTIPMSTMDALHDYVVQEGDETAHCSPNAKGLSCQIADLHLEPSTQYTLSLSRSFKDGGDIMLASFPVKTLTAVQLVDASVKNDVTIYDKPTSFTFTFDRVLESAEGVLQRVDGDKTKITASFKADGKTVVVAPKAALPRNASYQLVLQQVTGKDGGSLADAMTTNFKMSGGPKVSDVSVGATNVPQNAKIVVTFDQPIKADTDIAKLMHLTGVSGSVAKTADNTVTFSLASAPLCTDFTLTIDKGVPSSVNDETSADAWTFGGRTVCGVASTIGYSVKGRPITAYTFGSGSTTLLFTGGIHGSEQSGTTTMQALVTYLQANKLPADKKVVVVPNTNPDGIAANTRYNAHNVNLDRNFPSSNWRPDIDTASGILPTGGGTSAGSEPETRALINLTRQLRPRLEISFHAQGRLMGANQFGDSTTIGLAYARTVGYASMIGTAEQEMGYSITGEYEDWMGQEMGIPAILLELPSNYGNYLPSHMTAIKALFNL